MTNGKGRRGPVQVRLHSFTHQWSSGID